VTEKIIKDFVAKSGVNARQISDEEILERCLYPMINEGAKILEEGKAIRASDIDVVWENGYGWPVYRGGPMFYGDQVGLDKVLAKMKEFQAQMGDQFKPAPLLEKAGRADIVVGCGVDSITYQGGGGGGREPQLVEKYPDFWMPMIDTADVVAARYNLSREYQDEYSLESQRRMASAQQAGKFKDEIIPVKTR
jgi:acetyl-CoA acetyltransferase